jgi:hypothetical protein
VCSTAHLAAAIHIYAPRVEAEAIQPVLRAVSASTETDVDSDDQLALRAREQYRETGVPSIAADEFVAPHLEPGEHVLMSRAEVILRRVDVDDLSRAVVRDQGPLYITDRRLMHFGTETHSVALSDIDELSMADDRILVTLSGSRGITLDVVDPHQLRVLIAAAKAANRLQAG